MKPAGKSCRLNPQQLQQGGGTRFPRSHRLLTSAEYNLVFHRPIKSSDDSFVLLCRSNGLCIARLGLAVSKKNIHLAVDRNLIKRMIRESFRRYQKKLAGFDVVVVTKPGISARDRSGIRASLDRLWERLRKRCSDSNCID